MRLISRLEGPGKSLSVSVTVCHAGLGPVSRRAQRLDTRGVTVRLRTEQCNLSEQCDLLDGARSSGDAGRTDWKRGDIAWRVLEITGLDVTRSWMNSNPLAFSGIFVRYVILCVLMCDGPVRDHEHGRGEECGLEIEVLSR